MSHTLKDPRAVPPALANLALDALVRELYETSWGKARSWIESGKVSVNGKTVLELRAFVLAGALLELNMNAPRPGSGARKAAAAPLDRARVVYCDSQVVVVDKPSGISAVPYEKGETGTLIEAVGVLLGQARLEIVHRIDKETSGLMVFARTREAARELGNQFRFHTVHRRYLALAQGQVQSSVIRSTLIEDRGDGLRGSAPPSWRVARGEGQEATTHVSALENLAGATLIACRLETGRTHQIRIHLSEAGHPLLGERLYVRDYRGETLPAPRVMLHAAELGFKHPGSGADMKWERELPADFDQVLEQLRSR